jgi:hypothetical protein
LTVGLSLMAMCLGLVPSSFYRGGFETSIYD